MCGIAGMVGALPSDPGPVLQRMTSALAHRGPDAEGHWIREGIALGHRRLGIIDLGPASDQPFHSPDGRYTMVFNGEVYNYRELRTQLKEWPFRTQGDTEVLLAAFAHWGVDCLERLQGMFAFAVWDARQRELHVVRDRFGIKPLYIRHSDDRLLFASEVRALLASGEVPRVMDADAMVDYLRYQTVHAPATLVKGVRMVMPGHRLLWREGKLTTHRYWDPIGKVDRGASLLPLATVHREVRERLGHAVEKRLVSDVPFGAFLSGGIDSSAVVGLMAQSSMAPVHTFSVVFEEERFSEERFARMIARKFNTRHTPIRLRPDDLLRLLPEALEGMDHPSVDGPNTFVVSKMTKAAGITMALSGLGGDEVFAGYPVFARSASLMRMAWAARIPQPLRAWIGDFQATLRPTAAAAKAADLLRSSSFRIEDTYPLSRLAFSDRRVRGLLRRADLPPNAVRQRIQHLLSLGGGSELPMLSQVSVAELDTYLANVLLRDTDQMSMAHALEVRVPFLDHDLVEFVLGVGDVQKFPRSPKKLLVDALGDLLPEEVVQRPKMGFTLPWEQWMKTALRSFCEARLAALGRRSAFQAEGVRREWQGFLAGDRRVTWSHLWHLVVLEDWLERNAIEA